MNELCDFCQYKDTDECRDCAVIFDREYKKGVFETLVLHRNFVEKPMTFKLINDIDCFGKFNKSDVKCIHCGIAIECSESKIGGNTLTPQHRGDIQ